MRLKGLLGLQLAAQRTAAAPAAEEPSDSAPLAPGPPVHGCWGAEAAEEAAEAQLLAALAAQNGWASGATDGGSGSAPKRQKLGSHSHPGRQAGSQLSGGAAAASMSLASSRASEGEEVATVGGLRLRGVRFQGQSWQARTKRGGREVSLGLYNTAEEAGMAYDLDRLQQQGAKAQRLNYPLLRRTYKDVLASLAAVQAEAEAAEAMAAAAGGGAGAEPAGVDPCMYRRTGELGDLAVAVATAARAARQVPGMFSEASSGPPPVSRTQLAAQHWAAGA